MFYEFDSMGHFEWDWNCYQDGRMLQKVHSGHDWQLDPNCFQVYYQQYHQEREETNEQVDVVLSGLPTQLCNAACIEAILEQAGLDGATVDCRDGAHGEATVHLRSHDAGARCVGHFSRCRWAGAIVTAELVVTSKVELVERLDGDPEEAIAIKAKLEIQRRSSSPTSTASTAPPSPTRSTACSPPSWAVSTPPPSPVPSNHHPKLMISTPGKRWADVESDDEDEYYAGWLRMASARGDDRHVVFGSIFGETARPEGGC